MRGSSMGRAIVASTATAMQPGRWALPARELAPLELSSQPLAEAGWPIVPADVVRCEKLYPCGPLCPPASVARHAFSGRRRMKILAGALLLALCAGAAADEGLWTFDHFPKAMVKEKLGVDISDA